MKRGVFLILLFRDLTTISFKEIASYGVDLVYISTPNEGDKNKIK